MAMQMICADAFDRRLECYLWVEVGEGALLKVEYIRDDYWIVTGRGLDQSSWCCHAGTCLYQFSTPAERKMAEDTLKGQLSSRRQEWNKPRVTA